MFSNVDLILSYFYTDVTYIQQTCDIFIPRPLWTRKLNPVHIATLPSFRQGTKRSCKGETISRIFCTSIRGPEEGGGVVNLE